MWLLKIFSKKEREEKSKTPETPVLLLLSISQPDTDKTATSESKKKPKSTAKIVDQFLRKEVALWAKNIKTILQMFIGVGALVTILVRLPYNIDSAYGFPVFKSTSGTEILTLIGIALLYSSAIELAYTLFTPGPDEAVDPLITGLAAVILLGIAQIKFEDFAFSNGVVQIIGILSITLVIFFLIKKYLLETKKQKKP